MTGLLLDRFYDFLDKPLMMWSRVALMLLVIPLVLSFNYPLWHYELNAPQYPQGLYFDIFSYKIEGGNNGQHIQEINTLNHYIGMHKIDRQELSDLDWLPFALGALALYAMRVAALGTVRSLIDLMIATFYAGGFGLARFAYKLYVFGHNLDPAAPIKIPPFMPVMFGTADVANFTATSMPRMGTFLVGAYTLGVAAVCCWHLIMGRRRAVQASAAKGSTS